MGASTTGGDTSSGPTRTVGTAALPGADGGCMLLEKENADARSAYFRSFVPVAT
jgi:hypothetical protein